MKSRTVAAIKILSLCVIILGIIFLFFLTYASFQMYKNTKPDTHIDSWSGTAAQATGVLDFPFRIANLSVDKSSPITHALCKVWDDSDEDYPEEVALNIVGVGGHFEVWACQNSPDHWEKIYPPQPILVQDYTICGKGTKMSMDIESLETLEGKPDPPPEIWTVSPDPKDWRWKYKEPTVITRSSPFTRNSQ